MLCHIYATENVDKILTTEQRSFSVTMMAILPSITFLNIVAFILFATIATASAFIAVWHPAKHKRFCFAFLSVLQPHCEQFSGKDCVIAFPANVCKSGPAGARAQSQPYD